MAVAGLSGLTPSPLLERSIELRANRDLFTAEDGSHKATLRDLMAVQWGPNHPMLGGQ